jgi:hypothetical protein
MLNTAVRWHFSQNYLIMRDKPQWYLGEGAKGSRVRAAAGGRNGRASAVRAWPVLPTPTHRIPYGNTF